MRVVFKWASSVGDAVTESKRGALKMRVVPHWAGNCEENTGWNALATVLCSRTIIGRKTAEITRETRMTSRLEAYSVVAYNTAKLSENKMHDDQVARRFGFSGGLVPGVDVMGYMGHPPG